MNLFKKFLICVIGSAFVMGFAGCNKKKQAEFKVVATSFPCYDAARACLKGLVDDEKVSLKLLIKPGAEIHSFDPSPSDMVDVNDCNLFIYVGGESDEWVEKVVSSIGNNENQSFVRLLDDIETVAEDEYEEDHEHVHSAGCMHEVEEDEHVWTSPKNEIFIVRKVASEICKSYEKLKKNGDLDAKNREDIDAFVSDVMTNAQKYIEEIEQIENQTKTVVSEMKNKFIVMADRFPLRYFADYYGLKYDAAFSGCSTAVESSPATISRLIDCVRNGGLNSVYYIELGNHKIADSVAESAGVQARLLYSIQNISKDDFDAGETWVSLMKKNAETLKNN